MKTNKGIGFYCALLFISAIAFTGCVKDVGTGKNNGRDKEVEIIINVPASATRAITSGSVADNAVNEIIVLLFDRNDGGKYAMRVSTSAVSGVNRCKSFMIKVPQGDFEFVILANSADRFRQIEESHAIGLGMTKAQVLEKLTLNSMKWLADPQAPGYKAFPMWGEFVMEVSATSQSSVGPIEMARTLAKINLVFDKPEENPDSISDKLRIEEVSLCNWNNVGMLTGLTNWKTTPNASTGSKQTGYDHRIDYSGSAISGNACVDEIFLFEVAGAKPAANPSRLDRLASTCLIVKGYYDGNTAPSYYRIDLTDTDGNYVDVLRNHQYRISITDVTGPGLPTGPMAYDAGSVDIETTVMKWNQGYTVDFDDSGQFSMITSASEFRFDASGQPEQILSVLSTHPGGWEIEKDDQYSWIHLSEDASDITNDFVDVEITCDANSGSNVRAGSFYIVTKLLRKKITVIQDEAGITVSPDYLAFNAFGTGEVSGHDSNEIYVSDSSEDQNTEWTLVSTRDFVHLSTNPDSDYESSGQSVSGTGEGIVYVYVSEHPSINDQSNTSLRRAYIRLESKPEANLATIEQYPASGWITITRNNVEITTLTFPMFDYAPKYFTIEWGGDDDGSGGDNYAGYNLVYSIVDVLGQLEVEDSDLPDAGDPITQNPGNFYIQAKQCAGMRMTTLVFEIVEPETGISTGITKTLTLIQNPISESFARSNVVLKNGELTFAETMADNNSRIPQNSQGLFFKWGSLFGLSGTTEGGSFTEGNIVFGPEEFKWDLPGWGDWNRSDYGQIPYVSDYHNDVSLDEIDGIDSFRAFTDEARGNPEIPNGISIEDGFIPQLGVGDICRYITKRGWAGKDQDGKGWRMANLIDVALYYLETIAATDVFQNEELLKDTNDDYPNGTWPLGSFASTGSGSNNTTNAGLTGMTSGYLYGTGILDVAREFLSDNTIINSAYPSTVFLPASGLYGDNGDFGFTGRAGGSHISTSNTIDDIVFAGHILVNGGNLFLPQEVLNDIQMSFDWKGGEFGTPVHLFGSSHNSGSLLKSYAIPVRCIRDIDTIIPIIELTGESSGAASVQSLQQVMNATQNIQRQKMKTNAATRTASTRKSLQSK